MSQDSSVGIVTRYELDGTGIESRWAARFSAPVPDRPWGLPSLLYNGYRVLYRRKSSRGVVLTPHPHLSSEVMKG